MLKKRRIKSTTLQIRPKLKQKRETKPKERFENLQFSSGSSSDWYPELNPSDVPEEALGRGC